MTPETKKELIRWGMSSLVTFLTAFCLVMIADIDKITIQSFQDGTLIGLIFIAIRASVKALMELFIRFSDKFFKKE